MTDIFTAATLEEAKQAAAEAFGVPAEQIRFEIVEEPKRSLLGGLFGKKEEYRVRATFTEAAVTAEPAPVEEAYDADEAASALTEEAGAAEEEAATEPDPADDAEISPEIQLEKMQVGAEYLRGILAELAPEVHCSGRLENGIAFTLEGNGAGSLIGRRGETLDALQYLTSMVANRGDKDYVRLSLDTCGYRDKRRKALQELAQRISRSVLRTGKSMALEPMNPYERRIIHSAVTEIEGVSSHSSGEEPNRRVIVTNDSAPKRDDRFARTFTEHGDRGDRRGGGRPDRRGGDRGDRRGGGRPDRRGERRERRPGEGPRKLDLSTSFEQEYRRPKPEDALNAGVYGKIDI